MILEKIKILNTELVAATQDELLEVLRQGKVTGDRFLSQGHR